MPELVVGIHLLDTRTSISIVAAGSCGQVVVGYAYTPEGVEPQLRQLGFIGSRPDRVRTSLNTSNSIFIFDFYSVFRYSYLVP